METTITSFNSELVRSNTIHIFYKIYAVKFQTIFVTGKEYWLGLEPVYQMTKSKSYRLRITMKPFGGVAKTAYYENFRLKDNVIFFSKDNNGLCLLNDNIPLAFVQRTKLSLSNASFL